MEQHADYYKILGVPPKASFEELRNAFRKRVMQVHPDRGGTHEQMASVAEAWAVLSDPSRRAMYDRIRDSSADKGTRVKWNTTVTAVSAQAKNYPRPWTACEAWLDSFWKDVNQAEYGVVDCRMFSIPSSQNSVSASAFIFLGGVAGLVAGLVWFRDFQLGFIAKIIHDQNLTTNEFCGIFACPVTGAWIGQILHRILKNPDLLNGKTGGTPGESSTASAANRIVVCDHCGQKLRIPKLTKELFVKCPICSTRFSVAADSAI